MVASAQRLGTTLRPGTPDEAGMDPARVRRISDVAQGWVDEGHTPAMVLLAARRGVIFLHAAFGSMSSTASAPLVQPDTIFPLMSLTKPITATAIMMLVEDGTLGL